MPLTYKCCKSTDASTNAKCPTLTATLSCPPTLSPLAPKHLAQDLQESQQHRQHPRAVSDCLVCTECSSERVTGNLALLRSKGALAYTSLVAAPSDATLGMRYAALCAACSQGEKVRDAGGHALVVLDDISCMVSQLPSTSLEGDRFQNLGLLIGPASFYQ